MKKIERILVGFDFFNSTECAVAKARYLAEHFKAIIIPVHAVEHIPYHHGLNYWHTIYDALNPRIQQSFDRLSKHGIEVHKPVIREGRSYRVVLAAAKEFDADLIVLGCREFGIRDRIFGSTSLKVVRNASAPVLTVNCRQPDAAIKKILCPIDLSIASREVARVGLMLAHQLKAELTLLHVIPKSRNYPGLSDLQMPVTDIDIKQEFELIATEGAADDHTAMIKKLGGIFDDYLRGFDTDNLTVRTDLREGNPAEEIIATLKAGSHDLVIMGTTDPRGGSDVRIGDTTEKIIHDIGCSLLTVKFQDLSSAVGI